MLKGVDVSKRNAPTMRELYEMILALQNAQNGG